MVTKKEKTKIHTKYFKVAGITIEVNSDYPISENTFHPKFKLFEIDGPGHDNIVVHHHFRIDQYLQSNPGKKIYDKLPWIIYKNKTSWIYRMISAGRKDYITHSFTIFNNHHTCSDIYWNNDHKQRYLKGMLQSLTAFPSDQVLLARILADRNGCFFHSNGVVLDGNGYLFMGHSGYGKTTISNMLKHQGGKILCDDRMIVRKYSDEIKMYGNWCYGGTPEFSADTIPLKAFFFISKSSHNSIVLEKDKTKNIKQLLAYIVRPLVTYDWWENNMNLLEALIEDIPCYNLTFDLSGDIVKKIRQLIP